MKMRAAVVAAGAVALLAGCGSVVDGTGALAGGASGATGASSSPDFPGQSSAAPGPGSASASAAPSTGAVASSVPPPTPCPHVSYAAAKLSFDCLESDFEQDLNGSIWPLRESKTVEAKTEWAVEEGAGHWGPAGIHSLDEIVKNVRQQMVDGEGYGLNPTITTLSDADTTVDGKPARLLHTRFTLDPAWAKSQGTAVKQEQLWILAIKIGSDDVSLWYASIPNLVSTMWAKVPSIISSIKVG